MPRFYDKSNNRIVYIEKNASSDFWDAHWSIANFKSRVEGRKNILNEMQRVIKEGGYVFLTFPCMSPLRAFKVKLGLYKRYGNNINVPDFYQFALAAKAVQDDFEKHGFILQYSNPFDGLKGFKDEVLIFKPILHKLYDYNGRSSLVYRLRNELTIHLARFSAHRILMIFQRTAN